MQSLLRSVWLHFVLWTVLLLGLVPLALLFAVGWLVDPDHVLSGRFFRGMARLVIRLSVGWDFAVYGPRRWPAAGAAVVVSNHESHLDAFLISHLGWEMKWLAKRSLFFLPLVGWAMALAGDVPIVRGDAASGQRAMARMAQLLGRGISVFLFPEGTRAIGPDLLAFKQGAFALAVKAKVPIVPLAVAGTRTGLQKHSWRIFACTARVMVGQPIDAQSDPRIAALPPPQQVAYLIERSREQIEAMRRQLLAHIEERQAHGASGRLRPLLSADEQAALHPSDAPANEKL